MKRILVTLALSCCCTGLVFAAQTGVKKKRPRPSEYGMVVINNYSQANSLAPVRFDHWVHRSKFTCRLCHVDIGFAMKAGATGIRAADNMRGNYCGACHDGRLEFDGRKVFAACARNADGENAARCARCHADTAGPRHEDDFNAFAQRLPKGRLGNGIDWEKAEEQGLIKPLDALPGASAQRSGMARQKDFSLLPKVEGMPEIIFSHKKHTVWNGCEVCHPDLFVGIKRGKTTYSMVEIFDGKFCGVCHTSVAFPLADCQRCHVKAVM